MTSNNFVASCCIYVLLLCGNVLCLKLESFLSPSRTPCNTVPNKDQLVGTDSVCWEASVAPAFNCRAWCFDDLADEAYSGRIAALTNCNVTLFQKVQRETIDSKELIVWPILKKDITSTNISDINTPTLKGILNANHISHLDMLFLKITTFEWYVFQTMMGVDDMRNVNQLILTVTPKSSQGLIVQPDEQLRAFVRHTSKAGLYPVWLQVICRDGTLVSNVWELKYKRIRTIHIALVRGKKVGGSRTPPGETPSQGTTPSHSSTPSSDGSSTAVGKSTAKKRTCMEPRHNKITAVLSRTYDTMDKYAPLIQRTRSIFACPWSKDFDHVIFHDGGISKIQQALIKKEVGNPYLLFHNISTLFERRYTYPIGKNTVLSELHKCPAYIDEKKPPGYYIMCSFWYTDFLDTLCGQNYDYMLRIDDDNIVTSCDDPTLPPDVPFASPASTGMDFPWVIQGMNDFMRTLTRLPRSKELDLMWPKWTWDSPYTSVMWLNMKYLRSSVAYNYIRHRIEQSKCIFSSRWGDLPLWGATAQLMNISVNSTFVPISYDHGSLRHKIYPGKYVLVQNTDF